MSYILVSMYFCLVEVLLRAAVCRGLLAIYLCLSFALVNVRAQLNRTLCKQTSHAVC